MKKVYFMLLCAASLVLASCGGNGGGVPEQETLTGLPLVKKVFEQVTAADALATMRRSVYDSISMESYDQFYKTYTYKSSEDSIILYLLNDSVQEADVFYVYENNVIGTTCLQRLENEWGSSVKVRGLMLDSTNALITNSTTTYNLYKYQDIVDSIKSDKEMIDCYITYSSCKGTIINVTPEGLFQCNYKSKSNKTTLKMGYFLPSAS